MEQGQGEVLEIITPKEFDGKRVMDIRMPAKAIIGTIQRKNRVIIPKGDTVILERDCLIIFTTKENATMIKEFFKGN